MKVLDLFTGIGGFSLGLERSGMKTIAFVEIEDYPRKVLRKHWPNTPIYRDVKKICLSKISAMPDLICGGFPCQPFSTASHGIRPAENLWPFMFDVINDIRPKYVIAENVSWEAIEQAKIDLEEINYDTWYRCIGAYEAGADHKRNRWWLVAYPHNKSELPSAIDAEMAELQKLCEGLWGAKNYARAIRVPYGVPDRMDRLIGLGNSVLPQIPEAIGRAIMNINKPNEIN